MRRCILILIPFLMLGCTTADQAASTAPSSNSQLVRSLYEAFGRGDIPSVLGALDENVVWMEAESIPPAEQNPYRGPQAVAEGIFQMIPMIWNDFRVNVERIIDGGETIVALGRYRATHKQTGRPLDAQFVHVWDLRNGKIVRLQGYVDTAQFNRVATP